MNRVLILIALLLLVFVMISCGGDDASVKSSLTESCMNENEERIVPCATDDKKEQKQICSQGEWINAGFCYLCEEDDTRTIICATDQRRNQIQICSLGDWIDQGECLCLKSDDFCHSHGGLDWSDKSPNDMKWVKAVEYCENIGGRLPTISELRTLVQNCPATETGGECGVADSCMSYTGCYNDTCEGCEYNKLGKYSVFGDTNWLWSSSELTDYEPLAWYVLFAQGLVFHYYPDYYPIYVRCVR